MHEVSSEVALTAQPMQASLLGQTHRVASKSRYGSACSDPDVWVGLDHLGVGTEQGYGSVCGFRVCIGGLHIHVQQEPRWKEGWTTRGEALGFSGILHARSDCTFLPSDGTGEGIVKHVRQLQRMR